MKHTPGPWQQHGSHIYGPDPERRLIAQFLNPGTFDDGQMQANMTLTIATFALLEAAFKALETLRDDGRNVHLQEAAYIALRDAVAKAMGVTK